MNRKIWAIFLLLIAAAASLQAQRVAETIEVSVVEVPVTVVDRDGRSVRGLKAESFEVLDDGKRVPIEYFDTVDMGAIPESSTESPLPAVATRHFLLLFDLANSTPGTIARAGEATKKFVEEQLGYRIGNKSKWSRSYLHSIWI